MPITLQPEQEQFIQTQLATGRYTNATEVIAEALQLLEKRNHYDRWVEELRNKIDIAAAELDRILRPVAVAGIAHQVLHRHADR